MKKQVIKFSKDEKVSEENKKKIFEILKEEKAEEISIGFAEDEGTMRGLVAP